MPKHMYAKGEAITEAEKTKLRNTIKVNGMLNKELRDKFIQEHPSSLVSLYYMNDHV